MNLLNEEYLILSPDGFSEFDGLAVNIEVTYEIISVDNSIRATADHRFMSSGEWVYVEDLSVGDSLDEFGIIQSITQCDKELVYDPINVELESKYISNNAISHNCAMLYLDECVTGDTKVTVRNKKTGKIETLDVEELYRRTENGAI